MSKKKSLKITFRTAMVGFIVIPVVLAAAVSLISILGFSKNMTAESTAALGISQTSGISALVREYTAFLKGAAELDVIRETAKSKKADDTVSAFIAAYAENTIGVSDILLTDSTGSIFFRNSNAGDNTVSLFHDPDLASIAASHTPVSSFYENGRFFCASPIGDDGYIILKADANLISDYIAQTMLKNNNGLIAVFDEKDFIISSDGEPSSTLRDTIAAHKSTAGSFERGRNLGSTGEITGTKWRWIALYPTSAATPSAASVFVLPISVALGVCMLNVAIMILATGGMIKPLTNIIEKMGAIKDGDLHERFEVTGKNEFAQLAEAFNVMLDEVSFSEGLHRTISDISDNMLFEYDFVKEIMFVSDNFNEAFELNIKEAKLTNGRFIDSLMEQMDADRYRADMNRLLKRMDTVGGEYELSTKSSSKIWVSLRAHCVTNRLGELIRVLGVLTNIDNEKKLNIQLAEKATFDFLSGLYNRNTFEKMLEEEVSRAPNKRIAVLFVDIDDFKFINDRFNHVVGDEAIKFTAGHLKNIVDPGDEAEEAKKKNGFAGRFGGDEFVLCVTDPVLLEDLEQLSMDIIDNLYEGYYCAVGEAHMNIRVSIGIAVIPDTTDNAKALVAQADEAMYFVKKNGKSNYHMFDPEDSNIMGMF
jgi:diguanylate cyclase (GGDEF)-like protein